VSYVTHARAALTVDGRIKIARLVIEDGWTQARVAERFQVARGTVSKWVARYRAGGRAAMQDRSSRPASSPSRTPQRMERRIIGLRVTRRWGPHRIAYHLLLPQSTVSKVLKRYRVPLLGQVDKNTGVRVRKPKPVRYERQAPGELVHVDVKKLGRIPDGGGWRTLGRATGRKRRSGVGYSYLHSAIDDHARLVYSEILPDERKDTAGGFWQTASTTSVGRTPSPRSSRSASSRRCPVTSSALGPGHPELRRPRRQARPTRSQDDPGWTLEVAAEDDEAKPETWQERRDEAGRSTTPFVGVVGTLNSSSRSPDRQPVLAARTSPRSRPPTPTRA
jgi:transposase